MSTFVSAFVSPLAFVFLLLSFLVSAFVSTCVSLFVSLFVSHILVVYIQNDVNAFVLKAETVRHMFVFRPTANMPWVSQSY